jgi:hypothetical protein
MKFVLFVEGDTEQKVLASFLKRWLDPRLSKKVGIKPVLFDGWADMDKRLVKKARHYLAGPDSGDIIAVIALLDLYGPKFYPSHRTTAIERLEWAKARFEKEVGDKRFRMFFAVHETEAWLLSNPDIFPREIASGFPGKVKGPEEVDFDEPPSKLLERLYRQKTNRTYKKVTGGRELFDLLDPDLAYAKCPQLKRMLDEMLRMAKEAGL